MTPNISVTRQPSFIPWIYWLDSECFYCSTRRPAFMTWIYGLDSECISYSPSRFYANNLRSWLWIFQLLDVPLLCHQSTDLTPNVSVTRRPAFMPWIYGLNSEWPKTPKGIKLRMGLWQTVTYSNWFWLFLTHSDQQHPTLASSDPLWTILTHSNQFWPTLTHIGQTLTHSNTFYPLLPTLTHSKPFRPT